MRVWEIVFANHRYKCLFFHHIIAGAVSPASSGVGTVLLSVFIFILQAVKSPAMAAPVLSIIIGFIMAIGILDSGGGRKATKTATRATIFAFPSLAMYAFPTLRHGWDWPIMRDAELRQQ